MSQQISIGVCHDLRAELERVLSDLGREEVGVRVCRATCHTRDMGRGFTDLLLGLREGDEDLHLFGGACLRALAERSDLPDGVTLHTAGDCFRLLADDMVVDELLAEQAYLVTSGWLDRWRLTLRSWGFDQATAREFFAESAASVVLLDTGVSPTARQELERFAAFVDRPAQRVAVGLSLLRSRVQTALLQSDRRSQVEHLHQEMAELRRRAADESMILDLLGGLTIGSSEGQLAAHLFELASVLFAPAKTIFCSVVESRLEEVWSSGVESSPSSLEQEFLERQESSEVIAPEGQQATGFLLRISHRGETLGVLTVHDVALPHHIGKYLETAQVVAEVAGLAISNARRLRRYQKNIQRLEEALSQVETLSGLLPICAHCKKVRDDEGYWHQVEAYVAKRSRASFSHSLCPECVQHHFPDIAADVLRHDSEES